MSMETNTPSVDKLDKASESADTAVAEARLNIEMILESHAEERQRAEERHSKDMEAARKHYGKIILALVITLVLLVGSAFAGVIYVLTHYEIETYTTYQDVNSHGSGKSIIEDGIRYNQG